jgi:UrcA family protein
MMFPLQQTIWRISVMKVLAVAVSAIALLSTAAFAQDFSAVRQKTVTYGDLNLGSQDGVATLRDRIVAAANEVCASDAEKAAVNKQSPDYSQCRTKALHNAIAQVSDKIAYRLSSAQ